MNLEQARFNMVEQQIRTWEVLDQAVLDLLYAVPREEFVPAALRKLAFADMEIPIGEGEAMMAPKIEARIVQALALRKTDRVLEVGTGSGYLTALLARCAAHVFSLEIRPGLAAFRRGQLAAHRAGHVTARAATGSPPPPIRSSSPARPRPCPPRCASSSRPAHACSPWWASR